jgi:hypothetical protein
VLTAPYINEWRGALDIAVGKLRLIMGRYYKAAEKQEKNLVGDDEETTGVGYHD